MNLNKIFSEGLEGFLSDLINSALGKFDDFLGDIVNIALHADQYMNGNMNMSFDKFYKVIYLFGIYLIILKFLKKSFNTYVLWTEGDPDKETIDMCISFFEAIVVAISYSTIYNICTDIANDLINKSLASLNNADISDTASVIKVAITALLYNGLILVIAALVYTILFLILWIQFIKRGLELFILKAGMPLACVGIIDSDGGVFKVYCKKIIQELLTVFVQIIILKFSLIFMLNSHVLFGIAAINFAIKTPQFLSEFMMASGGSGAMSKISQTSMIIRNITK